MATSRGVYMPLKALFLVDHILLSEQDEKNMRWPLITFFSVYMDDNKSIQYTIAYFQYTEAPVNY